MAQPPDASVEHYRAQQLLARQIVARARRLWVRIDPSRLAESWSGELATLAFVQVSVGQMAAAAQADGYLDAVLAEQAIAVDRTATVSAIGFAGRASDGRSLESLLLEPIIAAKGAIAAGNTTASALTTGEASLVRIVSTQVQDAGRTSVAVATVARPAVTRYTRMLNPPSCSRCAILAGRVYRFDAGFQRHPLCDCRHIPTTEDLAGDLRTDPRAYFDSLSPAAQAKYFGEADAQAIRSGADMSRVVKTRMRGAGLHQANGVTAAPEGRSALDQANRLMSSVLQIQQRRPMPETIIAAADGDRVVMVEQLRRFGYLN